MDESVLEIRHAPTIDAVLAIRNQLARYGIENMLESVDLVVGQHSYADIDDAVAAIARLTEPDRPKPPGRPPAGAAPSIVLVVALSELDDDATSALQSLAARGVKILVLVDDVDRVLLARMAEASGSGFVFPDELGAAMLRRTLAGMQRGELPIPARLTRLLISAAVDGNGPVAGAAEVRMTPREREVLVLLVDGLSNKQIARRLAISEHGAKRHVANILAKLNCPNRTLAVAKALRDGLCEPPLAEHPDLHL
jgi:two-component system, NarL family, nitrate/nitrite response regulator NarL